MAKNVVKEWGARGEQTLQRLLTGAGFVQSETRIVADAQAYWQEAGGRQWKAASHWRDAPRFAGNDLWWQIGHRHLLMFEAGARLAAFDRSWDRVVEWGCGGGANAVHFAPRSRWYIGVDLTDETVAECARQVAAVCDTAFQPVVIDVAEPEAALRRITEPCDVFLCCYVFELIPTPEYGERVVRIAETLLAPGGLALLQIKYDDGRWWTRPRRRSYRRGLAEMTTYPIAKFWELTAQAGFTPLAIQLVPRNELDERYAYFLLQKG